MIVALVLVSQSLALGVAPGHEDIVFAPNGEHRVKLKIINNDNNDLRVVLYAEGELAEFVTFDDLTMDIRADEKESFTYYTLKLPEKFDKQGLHSANIVVRQIPLEKEGEGISMAASVAIIHKLNVMVPYSGKYVEITLFSPNFEVGKQSNFAVEVRNLGTDDILQAQAIVDIYGPLNNKLDTVYSDIQPIAAKDKKILVAKWIPALGAGSYYAVATVVYDELNVKDEAQFNIGTMIIDVVDVSVTDFKLGGIAKFDILFSSNWNIPVEGVYAETTITDESGKVYTKFKTADVDMPAFGKERVDAYWDTATVGPGKYKMNVLLNYLDKTSEKLFEIIVSMDKIQASPVGKLITPIQEDGEELKITSLVYILAFLVVSLIIFNVYMYFKKFRK